MNINIQFNPDGTALCLWTDAIPLHDIGWLEITRASTIEFNNSKQHWEVIDGKGRVRFFARSRAACLDWEHENLQHAASNAVNNARQGPSVSVHPPAT